MTKDSLYKLTKSLYESSIHMREVNEEASNVLLDMSTEYMKILERYSMDDDVLGEIDDIAKELLDG